MSPFYLLSLSLMKLRISCQLHICCVVLLWSAGICTAQESAPIDSLQQAIIEYRQMPLVPLAYYRNPALRGERYTQSLTLVGSEAGYEGDTPTRPLAEGQDERYWGVHTESFARYNPRTTIWGTADYRYNLQKQVLGRETLRYDLTAPYTAADTIGGFLRSETYSFSGGWGYLCSSHWSVGLEGSYQATQGVRDKDPRILNTDGDLEGRVGAAYYWGAHRLGLHAGGCVYKQVHQADFLSPFGAAHLINRSGFDTYFERFFGKAEAKAFNAYGLEVGLAYALSPQGPGRGLFASIDYRQLGLEFTLKPRNELRLAYLNTHALSGALSYVSTMGENFSYAWIGQGLWQVKRGDEYIYGIPDGAIYPILGVMRGAYRSQHWLALSRFVGHWRCPWGFIELSPQVSIQEHHQERITQQVFATLRTLDYHLEVAGLYQWASRWGLYGGGLIDFRHTPWVQRRVSTQIGEDLFFVPFTNWFRSIDDQEYLRASASQWRISTHLEASYRLLQSQMQLFVGISTSLISARQRYALEQIALQAGIRF